MQTLLQNNSIWKLKLVQNAAACFLKWYISLRASARGPILVLTGFQVDFKLLVLPIKPSVALGLPIWKITLKNVSEINLHYFWCLKCGKYFTWVIIWVEGCWYVYAFRASSLLRQIGNEVNGRFVWQRQAYSGHAMVKSVGSLKHIMCNYSWH